MSLNARQVAFVQEYLIDLNATKAAIRAGYSPRSASSIGERLMRKDEIRDAIAIGQERVGAKVELTAERVLQELGCLALVNLADMCDAQGNFLPPNELTDAQQRAIAKISMTENGKFSYVLHDKLGALEKIAKHFGMFIERREALMEHRFNDMSDAELEDFIEAGYKEIKRLN